MWRSKKKPDNTVRAGAALPGGKAGTPKARKPDPSQHTGERCNVSGVTSGNGTTQRPAYAR